MCLSDWSSDVCSSDLTAGSGCAVWTGPTILVVGPAALHHGAQVLPDLFSRGPAHEPPAIVDTVNGEIGQQREGVGHGHVAVTESRRRHLNDVELRDGAPLVI